MVPVSLPLICHAFKRQQAPQLTSERDGLLRLHRLETVDKIVGRFTCLDLLDDELAKSSSTRR